MPKETTQKSKRKPPELLKATIKEGNGSSPQAESLVVFHSVVRKEDGTACLSSRKDFGGDGYPEKSILGKTPMLYALEFALTSMCTGEIAVFKVKPEFHYGEVDCPLKPPPSVPTDELLLFEIELIAAHPNAKAISDDNHSVLKHIEKDGEGWEQPRAPYRVSVNMKARSTGGNIFFSTPENNPLQISLGEQEVPSGLELGICSMTRDEKAVIHVTGNSDLLLPVGPMVGTLIPSQMPQVEFEVELVQIIQVRDMLGDGSVIKTRLKSGNGEFPIDCPLEDSVVRIHYKTLLSGDGNREVYNSRNENDGKPFEFGTGEGLVPQGLDMSVRLMVPGEVASVTAVSKHAYDKFKKPPGVPDGAAVTWEVELVGFDKPEQWDGLSFEAIMKETEKLKNLGNQVFKRGYFEQAKSKYEKLLRELHNVHPHSDEETRDLDNVKVSLQLNISACFQKMEEYVKAIEWANKVLDSQPTHAKALLRRGIARVYTGDFREAESDFESMVKCDPSAEADAALWRNKLKKREQDGEAKARRQFKGLFDRNPGEISDDPVTSLESASTGKNPATSNKPSTSTDEANVVKKNTSSISSMYSLGRLYLRGLGTNFGRCSIL